MRVISQDGTIDIPYELSAVTIGHKADLSKFDINIRSKLLDERPCIVAIYSTEEKAKKAMEMLRIAYENNEFYHHTANSEHFTEFIKALGEEMSKKATSEYFQFPTEEELE